MWFVAGTEKRKHGAFIRIGHSDLVLLVLHFDLRLDSSADFSTGIL